MRSQGFLRWLQDGYRPIAGGALESNINGLWFAKQAKKGEAVTFTTGTKRGRWVGGDLQTNRADGEEAWSDQTLFADHVDFVNTLIGNGAPVVQGQSSLVAYLSWIAMGQEVVTGGVSAQQTLAYTKAATGGTFKVKLKVGVNTYTTAAIPYNTTSEAFLKALQEAFPGAWKVEGAESSVTATGGPLPTTGIVLTFSHEFAAQPVPLLELDTTLLTGTTPELSFTATVVGTNYKHVATPSETGGFWFGIAKSVGKSVVHRVQFNDCRVQSLRIEGSSASKVVKLTPTVISLDPGQQIAADPTKKDDGLRPFIYTEAAGTFEIDGTAYHGQSSFAVLFTWGLNEFYGDEVVPYDLINNVATCTLEGVTLLIDQAGLARFNSQIYGTTTPETGAKPIRGLPLMGSYKCKFSRVNPFTGGVSETLTVEIPGVKWAPTLAIPANPAGGAVELSFTGAMRKQPGGSYAGQTGLPPFRVTTENWLDPAFTA